MQNDDAEYNKIIIELDKLRLMNKELFKKRMNELKANKPLIFLQAADYFKLNPELFCKPKKSKKKESNPLIMTIVSIVVIGLIFVSLIWGYLILNPPTDESPKNSVTYGFSVMSNLSNTYLNYTYLYNASVNGISEEYLGKQYYELDNGDYTGIIEYDDTFIILKKINEYIYYDLNKDYTSFKSNKLITNSSSVLNLYEELYNLINNYYVSSFGKEGLWNLTNYVCVPLYFEINVNNTLFEDYDFLRYELCLNENGIPIALGKQAVFGDDYEIIIAYLESTDSEVSNVIVGNQTFSYWNELNIDDY